MAPAATRLTVLACCAAIWPALVRAPDCASSEQRTAIAAGVNNCQTAFNSCNSDIGDGACVTCVDNADGPLATALCISGRLNPSAPCNRQHAGQATRCLTTMGLCIANYAATHASIATVGCVDCVRRAGRDQATLAACFPTPPQGPAPTPPPGPARTPCPAAAATAAAAASIASWQWGPLRRVRVA
jgi:hypothetical protein